ncbi:MAG: transcription antitermination factor NusB [Firmicutes bacterium]|nr:transcription antitermination factor NusB [Bacillota bacterium]
MSRRLARQTALQILFEIDVGKNEAETALTFRLSEVTLEPRDSDFVRRVVLGVGEHIKELDQIIDTFAKDWRTDRMSNVDRNILRFAIFEICFMKEIDVKISINEAVELAKKFSDSASPKFINGILGAVVASLGDVVNDKES